MNFAFSTDYALIQRILTEARVYRRMANDKAPAADQFKVTESRILYVVATEGGLACGVFLLVPGAPGWAEIHFCLAAYTWGRTTQVSGAFLRWLWANSSVNVLIGPVPGYNRLALHLARSVGFQSVAEVPDAVTKHGRHYPLLILEAVRPNAIL